MSPDGHGGGAPDVTGSHAYPDASKEYPVGQSGGPEYGGGQPAPSAAPQGGGPPYCGGQTTVAVGRQGGGAADEATWQPPPDKGR